MKTVRLLAMTCVALGLSMFALSGPAKADDCEDEGNAMYQDCVDGGGLGVPCYLTQNPEGCQTLCGNQECDFLNECLEAEEDVCGRD
jgi:hypothetical protein